MKTFTFGFLVLTATTQLAESPMIDRSITIFKDGRRAEGFALLLPWRRKSGGLALVLAWIKKPSSAGNAVLGKETAGLDLRQPSRPLPRFRAHLRKPALRAKKSR